MSVTWGNSEEHTAAFREALEEFYHAHPEEQRKFQDMGYELQRLILARQLQIYNGIRQVAEGVR